MNSESKSLLQRLEQLEQQYQHLVSEHQQLHAEHTQSRRQYQRASRRLRVQGALAFCALVGAILISPSNRSAIAQGYGVTLQQLATRLTAVENKTQFMSADATAKSTTFSGCNVYINNGLGATDGNPNDPFGSNPIDDSAVNGLGNLILGYNEGGSRQVSTGSHNLIVGVGNSYSSYGGIVAGLYNTISAPYASVLGGQDSTASGQRSVVCGGSGVLASGYASAVLGGVNGSASGDYSVVCGGELNKASDLLSSTFGGVGNQATAEWAAVFGGQGNLSSGTISSVCGGFGVSEAVDWGFAAGGSGAGAFHSP